jgi:hypothetical protein
MVGEGTKGGRYWSGKKERKKKKAQKLGKEWEGRRMKAIPPPQEALTRRRWSITKGAVGKPLGFWWELLYGERSRKLTV